MELWTLHGHRARAWMATAILALVLVASNHEAGATILLALDIEKMSDEAVMVVQGHVAWDFCTRQGPSAPIYTYTGIEMSRCVVGDCPGSLTLKHRGGTVGELTQVIPGMPRFSPGQEVLLFLREDPEGEADRYAVFGMVQGFFLILEDPDSGQDMAVQQLEGVSLATTDSMGKIVPAGIVEPVVMDLEALVQRIRDARAAAEKGGGK